MMVELLYLILFAIMLWSAIRDLKRRKRLSMHFFAIISIAVFYTLVPLILFLIGDLNSRDFGFLVRDIVNSENKDRFICFFYVLLAFVGIELPMHVKTTKNKLDAPCKVNSYIACVRVRKICLAWFLILFVLGMLGICIMIATLGIDGFIVYSGASRGENALTIPSGSILAYGIKLAYLILASLVPGIVLLNYKHSWYVKLLLMVSSLFSILILIFNAGKTQTLLCLAPIVVFFLTKNKKVKLGKLVLFGVLLILAVPFLDNLFFMVSTGTSVQQYRGDWKAIDYVFSVLRQFSYPYVNLLHINEFFAHNSFRWGLDFLVIIVNSIPAFFLGGFQLDTQYEITTAFYKNILHYGSGGQPNDLIFFCYTQFGVVGIVLICVLYGAIVKGIDERIQRISSCCADNHIDLSFLMLVTAVSGIVFIMIEPYSVLYSFPMQVVSIAIVYHLDYKLRR